MEHACVPHARDLCWLICHFYSVCYKPGWSASVGYSRRDFKVHTTILQFYRFFYGRSIMLCGSTHTRRCAAPRYHTNSLGTEHSDFPHSCPSESKARRYQVPLCHSVPCRWRLTRRFITMTSSIAYSHSWIQTDSTIDATIHIIRSVHDAGLWLEVHAYARPSATSPFLSYGLTSTILCPSSVCSPHA